MIQRSRGNVSPFARWWPRLVSCMAFTGALGFLLHTSHEPVVFGKYDAPYAIFLALEFFVVLPGFYFLARFCAVEHEIRLRSGRILVVRPRHKLTAVFVASWVVYFATGFVAAQFASSRMMTTNGDRFHPYLQNTPSPDDPAQHVNHWGFRGDEIDREKADDVFRIFAFGGSTVFCGTVPYEQTHCRLLQRRLSEAYPQYRIEVQNLGADWHTTEHDTIKLLFFGQDFSPDLVFTFHAINDLVRSLSPDMFADGPYSPDYRHYLGAATILAGQQRKAPWLMAGLGGYWCSDLRFDQVRIDGPEGKGLNGLRTYFVPKTLPIDVTVWQSLPAFERNLRDFVVIARSKGMRVLLATQPSLYRDDLTPADRQVLVFPLSHHFRGERPSLHSMVEGMRAFNDATRQLATDDQVELVDLDRLMPKTTKYLYDDVHYTKAGNELVAAAFAKQIVESQIIDRVMRQRQSDPSPSRASSHNSAAGLKPSRLRPR